MKQENGMTAAPAAEKKTKVASVKQAFIDNVMSRPPLKHVPGFADEVLNRVDDAELREGLHGGVLARATANLKKADGQDEAILEEYHAEEEVEDVEVYDVDDDDDDCEEEEDDDCDSEEEVMEVDDGGKDDEDDDDSGVVDDVEP